MQHVTSDTVRLPWSIRSASVPQPVGGLMSAGLAVDRDIAVRGRPAWQRSALGGPAAARTYADGVHGRIWPSRPSVRRGTFLYASGFSRRRTPSARTLTTWWRWRAGSPVDWTQETHAYQLPSRSCLSQHSRWPIAPPVISTMGGDQGVRA